MIVVVLPVPERPVMKMLYPLCFRSSPILIAVRALSWPMMSSHGFISDVVLKLKAVSGQFHLSLPAGTSFAFGVLLIMSLRAVLRRNGHSLRSLPSGARGSRDRARRLPQVYVFFDDTSREGQTLIRICAQLLTLPVFRRMRPVNPAFVSL